MAATLITITLLHGAVLFTPGPNVLIVTQLAAAGDRRSALFAGLGITTVAVVWASLALLGVDALFRAHAGARLAVQAAGGLYLFYLAGKLWRAGDRTAEATKPGPASAWEAFRRGFLTNILNPKSALFFGSVFTTALPAAPSGTLVLAALGLVAFNALVWHALLALAFSRTSAQLAYAARRGEVNRLAAGIASAFALRLYWQLWQELSEAGART
jgi:threonine/homoserine/homoserine lactone efflux protein